MNHAEQIRPSILIVDDTAINVEILLELLEDHYDLSVALNGPDALALVHQQAFDLILLDIVMPGMDGYEVCRALKSDAQTQHIPVMFITGRTDENSIEAAFEAGGVDYVTKPFKPKELQARVRTHLELQRLIRHLEYISSHDAMTGLYNRGRFFELALAAWDRQRDSMYAAMVDIDHFKRVNDTYGHPTGDKVIQGVAQTLKRVLGSHAICGRIGGEEFAVVWPVADAATVDEDLEAMRQAVEALSTPAPNGLSVRCTISSGAVAADESMCHLDDLLKIADDALYAAKGTGRNRAVFRHHAIITQDSPS